MLRDQDKAMYYRQQGDRYGVGTYQHPPLLVDPAEIRAAWLAGAGRRRRA